MSKSSEGSLQKYIYY